MFARRDHARRTDGSLWLWIWYPGTLSTLVTLSTTQRRDTVVSSVEAHVFSHLVTRFRWVGGYDTLCGLCTWLLGGTKAFSSLRQKAERLRCPTRTDAGIEGDATCRSPNVVTCRDDQWSTKPFDGRNTPIRYGEIQ